MARGKLRTFHNHNPARIRFWSKCTQAESATPTYTKHWDIFPANFREFLATNRWARSSPLHPTYEALDFVAKGKVKTIVETYSL